VLTDDPKETGYRARTDAKLETLYESAWFYFPYPGKYYIDVFPNSILSHRVTMETKPDLFQSPSKKCS